MEDQVIIQRRFSVEEDKANGVPRYQGAIVLPESEYNALTPQQITDLKTQYYNGYAHQIKNPPPPAEEPPVEDKIAALVDQIEDLTAQKEQLEAQMEAE